MADDHLERQPPDGTIAKGVQRLRGNYYNAPTAIKDVSGVAKKKGDYYEWSDLYSGTAEALIAAGLLPADLFPGQPGRNITAQAYRPVGVERQHNKQGWHRVPGYMNVARTASGKFQIRLTVSREEQERREALREEDDARRASLAPPRASITPEQRLAAARTVLDTIVGGVGVDEVQRLLDEFKPRRPRPRASYLQLVASREH